LLSESFLTLLPSGKLHFLHQTLLEYAIAYWLTRHNAQLQREHLFTVLNQTDNALDRSYWLPVLQQLLTSLGYRTYTSLLQLHTVTPVPSISRGTN
jgi:hypothetical protein